MPSERSRRYGDTLPRSPETANFYNPASGTSQCSMQDPDHLALFDGSDDLRQDGDLHNETGIQAKASLSAHGSSPDNISSSRPSLS